MESQEKFRSYADVNREIQALIASKENAPQRETVNGRTESEDILTLLESLNKTYSEINAALQTENSQALKDVILKSDIKMSMVCETLLETLRKTTEEKNSLIKENQGLERSRRELESTNTSNKIYIDKLKSELDFKKINVEELNRIIADQKTRMAEFKEESARARNEVQFFKAKIDEIENLRGRANERMGVYEKELEALNTVIKDKDSRIQTLALEKRNEEEKNSNVKTRLVELESLVDALNKKLEVKDKNMALCNSELSKVLCENKKLKIEHEKYKESSGYYEGLYNSLNSQNAYLNSQLNKMLKMGEYSKDVENCVMKFKKKLKKRKKAIAKLEQENRRLKVEEARSPDDTSDSLLKKIEDLNDKNEKYKKHISELENEKKDLECRMKSIQINTAEDGFREKVKNILKKSDATKPPEHGLKEDFRSFPAEHKYPKYKYEEPVPYLSFRNYNKATGEPTNKPIETSFRHSNPVETNSRYSRPAELLPYKPVETYYKPLSDNVTVYAPAEAPKASGQDVPYLKLFNLDNDYGESTRQNNDFIGGFVDDSSVPQPKLEMNYSREEPVGNGGSVQMNNFDRRLTDKVDDNASVESVKTYHTSSTLKEMMAKTENLQKKFEDLENKLAQINEGESIDKLTDKIKTCNSYYSEWNVDSNESDCI